MPVIYSVGFAEQNGHPKHCATPAGTEYQPSAYWPWPETTGRCIRTRDDRSHRMSRKAIVIIAGLRLCATDSMHSVYPHLGYIVTSQTPLSALTCLMSPLPWRAATTSADCCLALVVRRERKLCSDTPGCSPPIPDTVQACNLSMKLFQCLVSFCWQMTALVGQACILVSTYPNPTAQIEKC